MSMYKTYKEFGFILMYYLPHAYALYKRGIITETSSRLGTDSLFYWSPKHEEVDIHDETLFPQQFQCYSQNNPNFTTNDWLPPNLNEHFKNDDIVFDKPILTIHNKNTKEWESGPFNYFNKDFLKILFQTLGEKYQIIYIRPFYENTNITKDVRQNIIDIQDEELLEEFPNVIWIKDLYNDTYKSYNELQFKILANSDIHIAPAGDCVIPAYFGGETIIFRHPQCASSTRGVWYSNSWLKMLSNSKITAYDSYIGLLEYIKQNIA